MILNKYTGIVVADSAQAKLFLYEKSMHQLELMQSFTHDESTYKNAELTSAEPGRYQKSNSPHEGAYEPHTTPKEKEAELFSRKLTKQLNQEFHGNRFSSLFMIAPAKFQGHCKAILDKQLAEKTIFVDKNYTNLSEHELKPVLAEIIKHS